MMRYLIDMGNYHDWSEEEFDWSALNAACDYLSDNCRRWARLGIWTKEKYGTMRVSTTCAFFGEWPIHNLVKCGHVCYRWPNWVMAIDNKLGNILYKLRITKVVQWYQLQVLKFFWKRAAKKWPHIAEEILDEYDWMTK